ncbi:MAG: ABC transporter ATP-binding protein [Bryobacteraceae bacterium]
MLRIVAGVCCRESGDVMFRGRRVGEEDFLHDDFAYAFRKNVGLIFQDPDVQLFCPSVFDEVAFGPLQLCLKREEVLDAVNKALEVFDIEHLRNRSPHHLSGGEKKRVALACVMVMDPIILLLDEPTAALDPKSQTRMTDLLERWHTVSRSIIFATHDLQLVSRIADQCVVLANGRLLATGSPRDILSDVDLLDQANLLDARTAQAAR